MRPASSGRPPHPSWGQRQAIVSVRRRLIGIRVGLVGGGVRIGRWPIFFFLRQRQLIDFLGDAQLVAHNAMFDLAFLNAELERAGHPAVSRDRMVDTLLIARRKHPGAANRLDDLCARYAVDNSRRVKHGALLDAELLAEVYVELIGARQAQLILSQAPAIVMPGEIIAVRERPAPLPSRLTADAQAAHRRFIASLGENAVWRDYVSLD